jgi:hypothetical protein
VDGNWAVTFLDDGFGFHLAEIGSPLMVPSVVAALKSAVQM